MSENNENAATTLSAKEIDQGLDIRSLTPGQLGKKLLSFQLDEQKMAKASEEAKSVVEHMRPSTTFFRDGMYNLMRNPLAVFSIVVLILIILMVIIAPMIVPYKYDEVIKINGSRDSGLSNLGPLQYSEKEKAEIAKGVKVFPHLFGTDDVGRDYFIRVVYGTRVSLTVGIFAALIVLIIGMIYGSISGYLGGRVDMVMMRIVDIIYSLPDLLLVIILQIALEGTLKKAIQGTALQKVGVNMISLFIVFAVLYWVGMARLVRGQVLGIKSNEYVLAAKALGAKPGRIIRKHILPNCMSVIFISTALQIPSAIFTESFLSFIGLGVQAPMPSLGSLANNARNGLQSYPYKLIFLPYSFV